ncbi:MAG: hypothetical protein A2X48_19645 [Lentisphaerae bacterium GWF2_49_21]|nr:MAG: hypothetical protein A2X48_19645 [Lentisphaerae bacterium GWF2_49_21]
MRRKKMNRSMATFIEYAMLAGLVAIVVAIAAALFGKNIKSIFSGAATQAGTVSDNVKKAKIDGDFSDAK